MINPFRKFFFWLFRRAVQEVTDEAVRRNYHRLVAEAHETSLARRTEYSNAVVESLVGKPVICFGNHNGNPIVGFCVRSTKITQGHVPVPVVADYVTLETSLVLGKVFVFTHQRYVALLNMTGEQRWSLFGMDGNYNYYDLNVRYDEPEERLLEKAEVDALLDQNNFWQLLSEYEHKLFEQRAQETQPA